MTPPTRLRRSLIAGVGAVALSAAYLALPARDTMDASTAVAVLVHVGFGLLLLPPLAWAFVRAFRSAPGRAERILLITLAALAGLCALLGGYLAARAAVGHSTARDVGQAGLHTAAGVAALLLALAWWLRARGGTVRRPRAAARVVPAAALLLTLAQGGLVGAAALLPAYRADEYYRDLTATNAEQAQNPLFPAGLRLRPSSGPLRAAAVDSIPMSSACGSRGCHPAEYGEWLASPHQAGGTDPFYVAARGDYAHAAVREGDTSAARWCAGCHAPAAAIRPAGDPATAELANEREGVGCYACHGVTGTPARTGDGRFTLAAPQDYPFARSMGWPRALHDFLIRVRPGPHQRAYLKPELHRSGELCSSCHRQSLSVAQNHYQFVRGPDEYGEWARGPASGRSARDSGEGPPRTCQSCHFRQAAPGGYGGTVSHLSPGGNTALAALRGSEATRDALERLRKSVSLDIFALRPFAPGHAEAWIAPLDRPRAAVALTPGGVWGLDVVERNVGVGHNFPAGYLDLDEAWLEVTVAGGDGRPLLENGVSTDPAAPVPDNAHVYGALRLDGRGRQILRHNLADQVTTAYQRAIPAGGADVARYRLLIPALARSSRAGAPAIRISARLMYRAVRPDYARWALAGAAPPVTTLAEAEVTVPLSRSAGAPDEDAASRRLAAERFVTYGRALLAPAEKPDIGGAMQAFHAAAELVPDRPEPWIGLGRAFLREPDLTLAAQNFDRALRCAPGSPAASAELSVVYNKQGQPQRAIDALGPLISRFPEDAALRYDLGLALFRAGRYQGAAEAFRGALAIDPDDYAAHFELKRCYEVVRNVPEARREEAVTRYMAEDRAAARLVPPFLASHPAPALRAEPFPIHELRRL